MDEEKNKRNGVSSVGNVIDITDRLKKSTSDVKSYTQEYYTQEYVPGDNWGMYLSKFDEETGQFMTTLYQMSDMPIPEDLSSFFNADNLN